MQAASGARFIFGLSSGAMIALEAARRLLAIEKAALYEPPFYPQDIDRHGIAQFKNDVDRGDLASALVTAGRIVGLAPLPVRLLPKRVARRITGLLLRSDAEHDDDDYPRLPELVPATRHHARHDVHRPTPTMMLPDACTIALSPGWSTVVAETSSITAGPSTTFPANRFSRR